MSTRQHTVAPAGGPLQGHPATGSRNDFRIVVMGVAGCGKTSVGGLLAEEIGGFFIDGDALHSDSNIAKMSAGIPLDDDDRKPWLQEIGNELGKAAASGRSLIIGCSALKRSYRDLIRSEAPDTVFVHLHGSKELLASRMAARSNHFMPASLLDSQFEALELLQADEAGQAFDIALTPSQITDESAAWIRSL